jgi:hypothetical protein
MYFEAVGVKRKMQLSELNEWHERAYHNSKIYKEQSKDGMTRGSRRRGLHSEIRYYFLILGLNYSGTENFKASGKDHLRW